MSYNRLIVALLCLAVVAPAAKADIDAMELRLLAAYQQDLRWDNVESAPEWVSGVKPYYHADWQMHRVLLAPGQHTTIALPAYQSLRLHQPKQILNGNEVDVYAANGSGLAIKQTLQSATDQHSLVLSPHAADPLWLTISRPASQTGDIEMALFISRKESLSPIAPYRNIVWSSAHPCLLGQEPFALPEPYNQLAAGQKQRVDIVGPVRLQLKNRLDYEQYASELIQDYRLHYWLDNEPVQELNFSTSVETSRVITVNNEIKVTGREQHAYLEIPQGPHTLVLQADRLLYLQLLTQTEQDYLFKDLNNPRVPVEQIRKQGLLPSTEFILQTQTAHRVVEDNSRQAGGVVGYNFLKTAALQHQDYPEALAEAEQLRGFRSFYRDLLPSNKADTAAQFMAYFLAESLRAVHRPQADAILADQHLADALKRVSNAYFTQLAGSDESTANEYSLPEQQTASQLHIIIDKRDCVERRLHIAIDQQPVHDLWLRCMPEAKAEAYARTLAETALIRLQQEPDSFHVSLDAAFSSYAQPAPLIKTAVVELDIAKQARSIKIWQSTPTKPASIALQYRAAKPFTLSEHSYLARLRDLPKHTLTIDWLSKSDHLPAKSPVEQQLHNEWLPLQRLLQAEYSLYKASVRTPLASQTLSSDTTAIATATTGAKQAEQQQQWLNALEQWGVVVNATNGLIQQQAQLAQANALSHLGEDYLAENLRRYLSLYADTDIAEQAARQLAERYQAQHDDAALLTLSVAMFMQQPSEQHSRLLVESLLKNGEYRFALLLGLNLNEPLPVENLLTAAYRLRWWETYQALQAKLPTAKRTFWQGLKAQQQGDFAGALELWRNAESKPWYDYLQQGLQLRERLANMTEKTAPALYQQWAHWQQQHPGHQSAQNALWHIKDYAGSVGYYALERDLYGQAVRATAVRPVTLQLLGPVTLNLQIRPLHAAESTNAGLDGWLSITDNHDSYRYPFTSNLPSPSLQVSGVGGLHAGNAVNFEYQVGQGWHDIKLNSEQAPLSISVQEQRPELPLSVLPILQADTLAELNFISQLRSSSQSEPRH